MSVDSPALTAAPNGEVLLTVKDVSLRLGGNQILEKVNFEVHDRIRIGAVTGQIVGVLGPSGVGKTRLLRLIAGLDLPTAGEVRGQNGRELPQGTVGVVFQNYPLLRHRTVRANLEVAGIANGMGFAEAEKRAHELLEGFHLSDRGSFYPAQLSGGQRQRVAIAQQLVMPKTLLLMDEPFSGLDPIALEEVVRLIVTVANLNELNTIVIITHDIRAALVVSDTVFMLGRERTPAGQVLPGAHIRATYDLVERGLAWRKDVEELAGFGELEREIKDKFKLL